MANNKTTQRGRDAKTGEFVTIRYADKHPSTTVIETIPLPKKTAPNYGTKPATPVKIKKG